MFDTSTLTPMQLGRLNAALDKRYNFANAGVMTLRQFIESKGETACKQIGDHSASYDRRKFNRMNAKEQAAYEARLARPDHQFYWDDCYSISIPKIVWDALELPLRA